MSSRLPKRPYFPGRGPNEPVTRRNDAESDKRGEEQVGQESIGRDNERSSHCGSSGVQGKLGVTSGRRRKKVEAQVIIPPKATQQAEVSKSGAALEAMAGVYEKEKSFSSKKDAGNEEMEEDVEEEVEEEEEDESEEDSSSSGEDEDIAEPLPLLKPVFVSRSNKSRSTSLRDLEEASRKKMHLFEEQRRTQRIGETQAIVKAIASREKIAQEMSKDLGDVDGVAIGDDEDREEDQEMEMEAWKIREWKRVMRDRLANGEAIDQVLLEEIEDVNGGSETIDVAVHSSQGVYFKDSTATANIAARKLANEESMKKDTITGNIENSDVPEAATLYRKGKLGKSGLSKFRSLRHEDTAFEQTSELKSDRRLKNALSRLHTAKKQDI